jgi:hypothetical protein
MDPAEQRIIDTADRLLEAGYISTAERAALVTDQDGIYNDAGYPVDVCENGDVLIHGRGAYPHTLKGFAPRLE